MIGLIWPLGLDMIKRSLQNYTKSPESETVILAEIQGATRGEVEAAQEATRDTQIQHTAEETCGREGNNPGEKGKRLTAVVFTKDQEIQIVGFFKNNGVIYNNGLMDYKDSNKHEAL